MASNPIFLFGVMLFEVWFSDFESALFWFNGYSVGNCLILFKWEITSTGTHRKGQNFHPHCTLTWTWNCCDSRDSQICLRRWTQARPKLSLLKSMESWYCFMKGGCLILEDCLHMWILGYRKKVQLTNRNAFLCFSSDKGKWRETVENS